MSISLFRILRIEECLNIGIAGTLNVHHSDLFGIKNYDTSLKLLNRLGLDVELNVIFHSDRRRDDLNPQFHSALGDGRRWMIQLAILNGLVPDSLPLRGEESVFQVDRGLSNQFITEKVIIVHHLDREWGTPWEVRLELIGLVEVWVRTV